MFKPILFNTEMVHAIQAGRKTQTRRIIKCNDGSPYEPRVAFIDKYSNKKAAKRPPCDTGDILWVREMWGEMPYGYVYRADGEKPNGWDAEDRWHPSIHMPKEAARIFLRVKGVRVERLQEITVLDAISEGCGGTICDHADAHPTLGCTDCLNTGWLETPDAEFAQLWDTTIKSADLDKYGWDANPWVWVIEFESIEKPEDWK